MTAAEPDALVPEQLACMLQSLGDPDWRKRQAAVDQLAVAKSADAVSAVIEMVRRDHRDLSRLNAAVQVLSRTEQDVTAALLILLADPHADVRAAAALILGERADPSAINGLVAAISDRDTNVCVHAIEAVGKLRAAAAVEALMQLVEVSDFELAFPALDALAAIGDRRVAHRLIARLQHPLLLKATVQALGLLGDEEAVICLLKLLKDSGGCAGAIAVAVRQIHARYLDSYGSENIAKLVHQSHDPALVAVLRGALSDTALAEQLAIIEILGWLPGAEAEAALLDLLGEPELCRAAVDALAARGPAITAALLDRFAGASRETRLSLIELCGRVGDRRPVALLLQCLGEEDEELIAKALDALSRTGDAQTYWPATAKLGHPSARVRQAAVAALNSLGHPATASDMQRLLSDPSPLVCESAVKVAGYFGFPECVEPLMASCDHRDERVKRTAVEHLVCLEDDRIVAQLQHALTSESAAVRAAAAGALGEVDTGAAMPLLIKALQDRDVWVRYFAVRSSSRRGDFSELQERLLALCGEDPAMQVRIAAVEALGADAIAPLAAFADGTDEDLAVAAIQSLGATGQIATLPALIRAAESGDAGRQAAAIVALGELGLPDAVAPLRRIALRRGEPLWEEATGALGRTACDESVAALLEVAAVPARRPAATAALIRLGENAVPALAWHLHGLPLDVRRVVVDALLGIRTASAIGVLESALSDREPAVRHSALSGLAHVRCSGKGVSRSVGSEGIA